MYNFVAMAANRLFMTFSFPCFLISHNLIDLIPFMVSDFYPTSLDYGWSRILRRIDAVEEMKRQVMWSKSASWK